MCLYEFEWISFRFYILVNVIIFSEFLFVCIVIRIVIVVVICVFIIDVVIGWIFVDI